MFRLTRLWPPFVGAGLYMVLTSWNLRDVYAGGSVYVYILRCSVGPLLGILGGLPSVQWYGALVVCVVLACVYCLWPKWYTAILSIVGGYLWLLFGEIAYGTGC